jgi:selenocysteine lyase/cysteine desulfurase
VRVVAFTVTLTRKSLLARGAGLALGAAAAAGSVAEDAPAADAPFDPSSWASVREQFAIAPGLHHLAGFVLAPHPRPVREAIERHRRGLDADPFGYLHEHQAELEARVRDEAARYLGGSPDEIALTDSTTMGLGLLYGGLRLPRGAEILTTEHDFFATHEALQLRAARDGTRVRRVRLYRHSAMASVDEIVSSLTRALTRRTRLVALTWVHSSTGVKLPIRAIADELRGRALLAVDGVHGLGAEDDGVRELGCDFLVAGTHKWLAGPRGTGLIWARDGAPARATIPSFDPGAGFAPRMTPGGYHSFEHRWAVAEAFAFHRQIGKARVAARIHSLAQRLKDGLAAMPQIALVTPRGSRLSAGIVCLDVRNRGADAVVERLFAQHRVVASVTPYATRYVRLGPGLYSSTDDLDAALSALQP